MNYTSETDDVCLVHGRSSGLSRGQWPVPPAASNRGNQKMFGETAGRDLRGRERRVELLRPLPGHRNRYIAMPSSRSTVVAIVAPPTMTFSTESTLDTADDSRSPDDGWG
jgi:hypothetical protein